MTTVNRLGVLSFARFQGLLCAFLGLLAGILYSFGGLIYDIVTTGGVNAGTALAFLALVGMPAIFAVVGFMGGIAEAICFNLFVQRFGGVELELG